MSWNITTFILHSKNVLFLATTEQPFLKYCINNAIIPLAFLIFYLVRAVDYALYQELFHGIKILGLIGGFTGGIILSVLMSFLYFFGADKTIYYTMGPVMNKAYLDYETAIKKTQLPESKTELNVEWFLSARFHLRKPRDIRHYSDEIINQLTQGKKIMLEQKTRNTIQLVLK